MKDLLNNLGENLGYFVLTLIIGIIFSGIGVLTPTISGKMITAFSSDAANSTRYIVLFLISSAAQIVFSQLDSYAGMQLRIKQKQLMRKNAFAAFLKNSCTDNEKNASFVSFINNDIPAVMEQYYIGTIDIIKCVFILVFSAVSLFSIHPLLAMVVFTSSGLIVLCPKILQNQTGTARQEYSQTMSRYNTCLQSFISGFQIIKSYGYYGRANKLQEQENQSVSQKEQRLALYKLGVQSITAFLQMSKTVVIITVGVLLIATGRMAAGELVAVVQIEQLIAAPAEVLAFMIHSRNEVIPLLKKYQVLICSADRHNTETPKLDTNTISLTNVSCHTGSLQILKDVNVCFENSKKYLICGESGSGKSTLMELIAQVSDLNYNGIISYDGTDIKNISPDFYYRFVTPVFQQPYLFHATLEENILLGRDIPKEIYIETIEKLNLGYLLNRYKCQEITPQIIEQLSGGEKQRVAIARAMVAKPKVYLLDEITSALDRENSITVEKLLLKENATVIHICHKANDELLTMYDKKFVMEKGYISENNLQEAKRQTSLSL